MTKMDNNLNFIEETQIKEGVTCMVYSYENDDTKDLGVVTVAEGHKTPLQKVVSGDRTLECFKSGVGELCITRADGTKEVYKYPGSQEEVEVHIGDTMQWEAIEDLIFDEICYPPYQEGRFENIDTE